MMSVNTALLRVLYPKHLQGRAFGNNSLVVAVAFAIGPTAASLILATASWPWLFAINVPLGVAGFFVASRMLPATSLSGHTHGCAHGAVQRGRVWLADFIVRRRRPPCALEHLAAGARGGGDLLYPAAAPAKRPPGADVADRPVSPAAVLSVVDDGHLHLCRARAGVCVAAVLFRSDPGPLADRDGLFDDAVGGAGGGDGADCRPVSATAIRRACWAASAWRRWPPAC